MSNMHYNYRAVRDELQTLCSGIADDIQLEEILIDLSSYENDDLVHHSLSLLTQMHYVEDTLFSHAAQCQLLTAPKLIQTSKKVEGILPTMHHLLRVDCDDEDLKKIVDLLKKLTEYCRRTGDEEPYKENQMLLYNYGNG